MLTKLHHRNIIKLHEYFSHVRYSFLVYEFMENGSLVVVLNDEIKAFGVGMEEEQINDVKYYATCVMNAHILSFIETYC